MGHRSYPAVRYALPPLVCILAVAAVLAAPEKRTITPGPIEFQRVPRPNGRVSVNTNKIYGSFVVSPSTAPDAKLSIGTGGACLIADLNRFDYPKRDRRGRARKCSENGDCQTGLPGSWWGYCDSKGEKICWVRPGPDNFQFCNKSVLYDSVRIWEDNKKHDSNKSFDLSAPRYPWRRGPDLVNLSFWQRFPGPVRWRVVACLNGVFTPGPGVDPPCGGGDPENRIELMGEPRWLPHPPTSYPLPDRPQAWPPERPEPSEF